MIVGDGLEWYRERRFSFARDLCGSKVVHQRRRTLQSIIGHLRIRADNLTATLHDALHCTSSHRMVVRHRCMGHAELALQRNR